MQAPSPAVEPSDEFERFLLSLVSTVWSAELSRDATLQKTTNLVFASSIQWPVEKMPFFVYVAAKPGIAIEEVESALSASLRRFLTSPSKKWLQQMQLMAPAMVTQMQLASAESVNLSTDAVAKQFGGDRKKALGMVLGQSAINRFVLRRWARDEPDDRLKQLKRLTSEELKKILDRNLQPERQRVIRVVPQT